MASDPVKIALPAPRGRYNDTTFAVSARPSITPREERTHRLAVVGLVALLDGVRYRIKFRRGGHDNWRLFMTQTGYSPMR